MSEALKILPTSDGHHTRGDLKMMASAVNRRWIIPKNVKEEMPAVIGTIALTSDSERERIAAAKVIVAMEGQNQADDHLTDKNERLDSGKPTENNVTVLVIKGVSMDDL